MTPAHSLDEVIDLYARFGDEHYDEDVSQLEHARQTASLAEADGADDALVAAALLHDVGHLLEVAEGHRRPDGRDLGHEATGARFLAELFGTAVTRPIALHVRAKRYRCAVDPTYHDALSAGSRASLVRQGGPLRGDEVGAFERTAGFANAVRLRGWDEGGKVEEAGEGLVVAPFEHFEAALGRARRAGLPGPDRPGT
jgi:phosphonate degradation associated HDIG domain protein